jgi:O-methyltransferase
MNILDSARRLKRRLQGLPVIKPLDRTDPRLKTWISLGIPSYDANNLVTWGHSVDFMSDKRFLSAYKRGMDSGHQILRPAGSREDIHIEWRVAIACWAAQHATRLPGDFVECGTNTGIVSLAICEYVDFNATGKSFWLFDTFSGIPLDQISGAERALKRERDNVSYPECYEVAKRNFAAFPRAQLVKGRVPDTLSSVPINAVSYLHLDMNIAYPERAAIEHFWPKMPVGAIALLDDYGWANYREQKSTMDDFASRNGVPIMMLPTGQGILIKS